MPLNLKNKKMICAPSEDSASTQSDLSSLCAQWVAKDPSFLQADSNAQADLSLAGRTCHFVGFVIRWLK